MSNENIPHNTMSGFSQYAWIFSCSIQFCTSKKDFSFVISKKSKNPMESRKKEVVNDRNLSWPAVSCHKQKNNFHNKRFKAYFLLPITANECDDWFPLSCRSRGKIRKFNAFHHIYLVMICLPNAFLGSLFQQLIWNESEKHLHYIDEGSMSFRRHYLREPKAAMWK